jgi:hypothetical protein
VELEQWSDAVLLVGSHVQSTPRADSSRGTRPTLQEKRLFPLARISSISFWENSRKIRNFRWLVATRQKLGDLAPHVTAPRSRAHTLARPQCSALIYHHRRLPTQPCHPPVGPPPPACARPPIKPTLLVLLHPSQAGAQRLGRHRRPSPPLPPGPMPTSAPISAGSSTPPVRSPASILLL